MEIAKNNLQNERLKKNTSDKSDKGGCGKRTNLKKQILQKLNSEEKEKGYKIKGASEGGEG